MSKPDPRRRIAPVWWRQPIDPLANLALARQRGEDVSPANRRRWRAYRSVLQAAGVDPETLVADGERYSAAVVRQRWLEPCSAEWDVLAADVPGFPPLAQAEWKPVYALGNALRLLLGLNQTLSGSKQHDNGYVVDQQLLDRQRQRLDRHEEDTHAQN